MIACWDCRNLTDFEQSSGRGDGREITVSPDGLRAGPWSLEDERPPGTYCASCDQAVEADLSAVGLLDDRIEFISPADFEAAPLGNELRELRADADWTELEIPRRDARTAALTADVDDAVRDALERTGRLPLYTHQVQAIDLALRGRSVIQATSAGSGKSVGFLVPVLQTLLRDESATGLLIFPLRALANDQLNSLARWGLDEDPWVDEVTFDLRLDATRAPIRVARYDGATPQYARPRVRREARLIIATPDVIHYSVLRMAARTYSDGSSWGRLLRGLRWILLDEIHTYQGVFGSNVGQVIRRLRRASEWHGGKPRFLAASATIGNPVELAGKLTGSQEPFELVDDDGSPRERRVVLICNPPAAREVTAKKARIQKGGGDVDGEVRPESLGRLAPQTLALDLIPRGALASEHHDPVRTICFARSRNSVFALAKRLRAKLTEMQRPDIAEKVAAYAATFLADDRVEQEGKLRDGSTIAIVSTNALELGIDIPDLSLAVLCGYPGQISSFRQRAGRVGRTGEGLILLIVGDDPLQQYIANHPEELKKLLDSRPEDVVINPDAEEVVKRYGLKPGELDLGGVAFEDATYFGRESVHLWLSTASSEPSAQRSNRTYWATGVDEDDAYQNLRSASDSETYTVYAVAGNKKKAIGTLDKGSAPRDAFVPAIWTAPEATYRVIGFDARTLQIHCEGPVEPGYLTRGMPQDTVAVIGDIEPARRFGSLTLGYSNLDIDRRVYSYKEIDYSGGERTCQVEVPWPPVTFQTEGLRVHLDPSWLLDGPWEPEEALKGFEHVLLALAPTVVSCDPVDLDASREEFTVYLYDSFGGGIGISRPAFERFSEIIELGFHVVSECDCTNGCPSCIALGRRPDGNAGLSKPGAISLLQRVRSQVNPNA